MSSAGRREASFPGRRRWRQESTAEVFGTSRGKKELVVDKRMRLAIVFDASTFLNVVISRERLTAFDLSVGNGAAQVHTANEAIFVRYTLS